MYLTGLGLGSDGSPCGISLPVRMVEFAGTRIAVSLDGRRYIDFSDDHISGAGSVGVWTKADSVTAFSEFAHQAARP